MHHFIGATSVDKIEVAWVEVDNTNGISKLCVRYNNDNGAEVFGCFFENVHHILPQEFEGLSLKEAYLKFNEIVYGST